MPLVTVSSSPETQRQLLHVGCGVAGKSRLPKAFHGRHWREVRLDIDPGVRPDIVGTITDLHMVSSACVDAIWSSHNLEHLHSFEVPGALQEFRRVLKPDGFALVSVPNLRALARYIAIDQHDQPLYHSAAGPISPLDILFGHQASIADGNHFMAHRTGFTSRVLGDALLGAGFSEVRVHEGRRWDLWALALMPATPSSVFEELADVML